MGAPTGWRVAGFHARTVPSPSPVASSLPSGLNATACTPYTLLVVAWRVATGRPVAGFHSRTVPSPQPAGQQLAVGAERHPAHAGIRAGAGLEGTPTGRPVAGFHSRTVPSPPPLASSLPSGLNATT